MTPSVPLEVRRPRRLTASAVLLVVAVVAVVGWWFVTHPPALPTSERRLSATTTVGQPVFLGVFAAPADFGRTLSVDGIKVHATSNVEVTVRPWLCRGGAPVVTTDAAAFCTELVDPEGTELGAGDTVVLEVRGDQPGAVVLDRVRVGYREGLRAATQAAGAGALVTLAGP